MKVFPGKFEVLLGFHSNNLIIRLSESNKGIVDMRPGSSSVAEV